MQQDELHDLRTKGLVMDRRKFLSALIGGVATAAAVRTFPFRVFSFPKEITGPDFGGQTLFADYDENGSLTNRVWHYDYNTKTVTLFDNLPFTARKLARVGFSLSGRHNFCLPPDIIIPKALIDGVVPAPLMITRDTGS